MKIACFSPNDAIWRWTFPQAQFLEALQQRGDTIEYLYCDRTFSSYCMSMAVSGVSANDSDEVKGAICEKCAANSNLVRDKFGFQGYPLHTFLIDAERAVAHELAQKATIDEMCKCEIDGVAVGKFALYETIIQTKAISLQLSDAGERLYRFVLVNSILTAFATRRALEKLKPDAGITYHSAYSYNRVFQHRQKRAKFRFGF